MTNLDLYNEFTSGADLNDLHRFDGFLVGWLLSALDEDGARAALEAAAALVNLGQA